MDDMVRAAMQKWPDVPDVYNWLMLDARGRYRIRARDYDVSRRFDTIGNSAVVEFIGRNYQADDAGRWFFQNGPQRVFVSLAVTPWVFRFDGITLPVTHTGRVATRIDEVLIDEHATPLFATDLGPGTLDDRDLAAFLGALDDPAGKALADAGVDAWLASRSTGLAVLRIGKARHGVDPVARATLAGRFGFDPGPQPPAGASDC